MEFIKCNLCGNDDVTTLDKETELLKIREPFQVVRCKICGLAYQNPRPSSTEIAAEYADKEYYDKYDYEETIEKVRIFSFEKAIGEINKMTRERKKILDLGSAFGDFLLLAKESGWTPYGVDISPWAVKSARKRVAQNIFEGVVEQVNFPANFFDAVFSSNVIEHLPDPLSTLHEVYRICKRGAVFYLQVPNELKHFFTPFYFNQERLSVLSRVSKSFFLWLIYQTPLSEIPSPHLYFFTPKTLKKMVEKAGFKVLKIETMRENRDLGSQRKIGKVLKRLLYWLEEKTMRGPTVISLAVKQ